MELSELLLLVAVALSLFSSFAFWMQTRQQKVSIERLKGVVLGLCKQCTAHVEIRDALKYRLKEELVKVSFNVYEELGNSGSPERLFYLRRLSEFNNIIRGTVQTASAGGQSPLTKTVDLAQYRGTRRQPKDNQKQ